MVGNKQMSIKKELKFLRDLLTEQNQMTDRDYLRSKKNRMKLHKKNPTAFAVVDKKGVPRFALTNKYGGMSATALKQSLSQAKRLYTQTGKDGYKDVMDKITICINKMENGFTFPIDYELNGSLKGIIDCKGLNKHARNMIPKGSVMEKITKVIKQGENK